MKKNIFFFVLFFTVFINVFSQEKSIKSDYEIEENLFSGDYTGVFWLIDAEEIEDSNDSWWSIKIPTECFSQIDNELNDNFNKTEIQIDNCIFNTIDIKFFNNFKFPFINYSNNINKYWEKFYNKYLVSVDLNLFFTSVLEIKKENDEFICVENSDDNIFSLESISCSKIICDYLNNSLASDLYVSDDIINFNNKNYFQRGLTYQLFEDYNEVQSVKLIPFSLIQDENYSYYLAVVNFINPQNLLQDLELSLFVFKYEDGVEKLYSIQNGLKQWFYINAKDLY